MTGASRSQEGSIRDLIAIGCGPFNLSLAALASSIEDLDFVALDASSELRWHPGLMLEDAMLQVGFLADLVSLVEPTHPLSFLAYLKDRDRMYPFYIREQFHMTRREYEDYLRWVASKLASIRFCHRVRQVEWDALQECFVIDAEVSGREPVTFRARHLALGIGTEPFIPDVLAGLDSACLHSGEYLEHADRLAGAERVTVVGSGQSGAEVVRDLLARGEPDAPHVSWLTRTPTFAPLDYTKLVLEMTTPEYVRYFHGLAEHQRDLLVREQWRHYKGISTQTLEDIHDLLYQRTVKFGRTGAELRCGTMVETSLPRADGATLRCLHRDTDEHFVHETDLVVAATGYRHRDPDFLAPLEPMLRRDGSGRLAIRLDHGLDTEPTLTGRLFVANADLHSHGVAAPDLGIVAYRNAAILNAISERPRFALPERTAFSKFAPPDPTAQSRSAQDVDAGSRPMPLHLAPSRRVL